MLIKNLKEIDKDYMNKTIEATVLIVETKVKTARNDKVYADMIIQDASKQVEAKYWDYAKKEKEISSINENDPVKVKCVVGEYQGRIQLTIKNIEKIEGDFDLDRLIPSSDWGTDKLENGLKFFYDLVEIEHLRKLLDLMILDEKYKEKFCSHPAAKRVHHNFRQGLLQHVLEVLKFAYTIATTKKLTKRQTSRLIVMCFLHDWAKIIEYKSLPAIGFTDEGTMLGHIFLGAHHTLNCMNQIDNFDEDDKLVILNGILGHHGKYEYGSPVLPKTVEAQILHLADVTSGDVESIISFSNDDDSKESFTPKLWNMGTDYFKR
ncbi:MAG: 3'-5' exoribonuclease YhaM family protein [Alkaliphilus sp.]